MFNKYLFLFKKNSISEELIENENEADSSDKTDEVKEESEKSQKE